MGHTDEQLSQDDEGNGIIYAHSAAKIASSRLLCNEILVEIRVESLPEPARNYACEGVDSSRKTCFARRLTPAATVQRFKARESSANSLLVPGASVSDDVAAAALILFCGLRRVSPLRSHPFERDFDVVSCL